MVVHQQVIAFAHVLYIDMLTIGIFECGSINGNDDVIYTPEGMKNSVPGIRTQGFGVINEGVDW